MQGVNLAEKGLSAADALARMGDDASSAADIFSGIPILGTVFKMVAGAADRMLSAFNSATAAGSSFGGSITQFSAAATTAGMNLQEFGALIARNGQSMAAFGTTTEGGAAYVMQSLATNTQGGQAIISTMREARNQDRLSAAGITTDIIVSDEVAEPQADLETGQYTVAQATGQKII
jgi:hypothetical protein